MRMVGFGLKCPQAHPIKFSGLRRPNWANCGTAYAVLGGCVRLWLLILYAVLATAQEDHSQHQHAVAGLGTVDFPTDRKSTRLNSSHLGISYAVFCLKKKQT